MKAVNVNDVLKILYKYGEFLFVTDYPKYREMQDEIANLPKVTDSTDAVLDKIRAEIEKLRPNLRPEQMTDYDYAMVDVVDDIVAIIDKYKAESEEQRNGRKSI